MRYLQISIILLLPLGLDEYDLRAGPRKANEAGEHELSLHYHAV